MGDPLDDLQQIRNNPLDDLKELRGQSTRTSTPTPAQAYKGAKARVSNTLAPTEYQGPFADYGIADKPDPDPTHRFWSWEAAKKNLNPMNLIDAGLTAASNFVPEGAAPGMQRPINDVTPANFVRDMGAVTQYPTPYTLADTAKESYSRGMAGQSTADMYQAPAAMAAGMALPHIIGGTVKAILPPDIAAELARKAARSAIGVGPENFKHGATPDVATLEGLDGGLPTRSEGRLLNKIKASKNTEFNSLEQDVNTPANKNNNTDPLQPINATLDDIDSRTLPEDKAKVASFRALVTDQVRKLSSNTMQLNPLGLVKLKRWLDDIVGDFKDDPGSTTKNMAQKVYGTVRQHLDTIAPEVTSRSQRIQSLIQAEDALTNKIYTKPPEPHTTIGAVRDMFSPIVPSTLIKTNTAAALKALSGGAFDRPPLLVSGSVPPPPTAQASNIQAPVTPGPPPIRGLLPPASSFITTPQGTTMPSLDSYSGMASGLPESPGTVTPATASGSGAPTSIDPFRAHELAAENLTGSMKYRAPGNIPRFGNSSGLGMSADTPITPEEHSTMMQLLDHIIKEQVAKDDTPNLTLKDEIARRAKAAAASNPAIQPPVKPTHITVGMQVSGMAADGNIASGVLEHLYPGIGQDGNPTWRGTFLAHGNTVDLPADRIFDKLKGPPKELFSKKAQLTPAPVEPNTAATQPADIPAPSLTPEAATPAPAPVVKKSTTKGTTMPKAPSIKDAIPTVQAPEGLADRILASLQKAKEENKAATPSDAAPGNASVVRPDMSKNQSSKKAVSDWLDKYALDNLEDRTEAGKPKKGKK